MGRERDREKRSAYKWDVRKKRGESRNEWGEWCWEIYSQRSIGSGDRSESKENMSEWEEGVADVAVEGDPSSAIWLGFHVKMHRKKLLHLTPSSFLLSFFCVCLCLRGRVCLCSQLDYNHISCIEDGAFRALRDLEVLWVFVSFCLSPCKLQQL